MGCLSRARASGHRLDDETSRASKATKIIAALAKTLGRDWTGRTCLDIGCSSGLITQHLASRFRYTLGVEYDAAVKRAAKLSTYSMAFARADALRLPVRDSTVDVVVCAQVYEHVANAEILFSEIWRVLVDGGVCFLSGPNKLYPVELHYRLPLIHWLPASWAGACLRALGRGKKYDIRSLTPRSLRRHLAGFEIQDLTVSILRDPQAFAVTEELGRLTWVSRLPDWLLRVLVPFVPNVNWVLRKPVQVEA